jgi:hypothetical protein
LSTTTETTMSNTKNLIRKTFLNRWALGLLVLAVAAGVAYLVWGEMGLIGLGGAAVGLGLPLLFGASKAWTTKDQAEHDRRWKWDGSNNDDNLSN